MATKYFFETQIDGQWGRFALGEQTDDNAPGELDAAIAMLPGLANACETTPERIRIVDADGRVHHRAADR